jgi:hypothetical protein
MFVLLPQYFSLFVLLYGIGASFIKQNKRLFLETGSPSGLFIYFFLDVFSIPE